MPLFIVVIYNEIDYVISQRITYAKSMHDFFHYKTIQQHLNNVNINIPNNYLLLHIINRNNYSTIFIVENNKF